MKWDVLYQDLEARTADFARHSGQACPPGCGACCRKPSRSIEASPEELGPLAVVLWDEGIADQVLVRAREAGAEGWCVLFEPGPDEGPYPQGQCSRYAHRPLTCRLFGVAAVRDRAGTPRPALSSVMKTKDPGLEARVAGLVAEGLVPPVASEWRLRLAEIAPAAATDLRPLNEALAVALEREGLARRFRSADTP